MKKYKTIILLFLIFGTFILNFNNVSAESYQATFSGCSKIICKDAGYNNNGKWEGLSCDDSILMIFPEDSLDHLKVILPDCNLSKFDGWILNFRSTHDYQYATFCDDGDTSTNHIKYYKDCKNPHVFNKKLYLDGGSKSLLDIANDAGFSIFNFVAKFEGKKTSEYNNSESSLDFLATNGNNEENYDDNKLVSCGPNLLSDIPSSLPSTIHIIYLIIQLAVPILLVVLGIIDFIKSISNPKDEEIKKGQKKFITRIFAGVIVFFVFSIVKLVISLVADDTNSRNVKIINCMDCIINNNDSCLR